MSCRGFPTGRTVAVALALALPAATAQPEHAAAGMVVALQGRASIMHDGVTRMLDPRDTVYAGDVITTQASSLIQLQMNDGALISLRPQSTLVVARYETQTPLRGFAARDSTGSAPRILLRLVKGALRTVTGITHAIGNRARDEYRLETPIATIGIRGTDYGVAVCAADCADSPDGMYVGVFDGAIDLENAAGRLTLERGEFAYVADSRAAPQRQSARPEALTQAPPSAAIRPADGSGNPDAGTATDLPAAAQPAAVTTNEPGTEPPSTGSAELVADTSPYRRSHAVVLPGQAAQAGAGSAVDTRFDSQGGLTALALSGPDGERRLSIGSASNRDAGADADTGLRWGRWSDGTAQLAGASGDTALDLTQQSLHWIMSPEYLTQPVLPRTGFAAFDLIGATAPTDQTGLGGTLGHADLVADFDRQLLYSSLDLNIGGDRWHAWGTTALDGSATFSGTYDHVTVNLLGQGSGDFSGFFVGAGAVPAGAGLSYHLRDANTDISGVAAFVLGDHASSGGP